MWRVLIVLMWFLHTQYISDKKQITYILTQNGIAIPVRFKFFRVQESVPLTLDMNINGNA